MKWPEIVRWMEERRDVWIDLLRIYLGIGLFIRGSVVFAGGGQIVLRQLAPEGSGDWFMSAAVAHYVVLAHLAGGLLLALGLLTRLAALVQLPVLVGAVILHAPDGLFSLGQSLELAAFVLVTLLFIIVAGPGRLSVDYYTFRFGARARAGSSEHAAKEAEAHGQTH